jgi:hypothetical protein
VPCCHRGKLGNTTIESPKARPALGHVQCIAQGCWIAALARFGWSNLGLDDILLERRPLLQETTSSTQKVKRKGKSEKEREKVKQLLRKRESIMSWTNIIDTYYSIYFLGLCLRRIVAYHYPLLVPLPFPNRKASNRGC